MAHIGCRIAARKRIQNERQYRHVVDMVEGGLAEGAQLATGHGADDVAGATRSTAL